MKTMSNLVRFSSASRKSVRRNGTSSGDVTTLNRFKFFLPVQTRWNDNDQYGHMNNAVHHSVIDTIVNNYLMWECGLDSNPVGFMVKTNCSYMAPVRYPDVLLGAMAVTSVGRSSVKYEVALFKSLTDHFLAPNNSTRDDKDPFTSCGIGLKGRLVDGQAADEFHNVLSKHFGERPVAVGYPVHVFVDSATGRPVSELSEQMMSGLGKIMLLSNQQSKL